MRILIKKMPSPEGITLETDLFGRVISFVPLNQAEIIPTESVLYGLELNFRS